MSAPRKIWANVIVESNGVGLCGEWNHADCGHLEDEVYHHDDVVRELIAALEDMLIVDGKIIRTDADLTEAQEARRIARAALAKIAQEDRR